MNIRTWFPIAAVLSVVAIVALSGALFAASASGKGNSDHAHAGQPALPVERTEAAIAFREDMRELWEDHIVYTRLFIISAASDHPDLGPTTDRLLANQADIGDAVKPFYGDEAGNALTELLREHILIAADLVAAAKAGNTVAFDEANSEWGRNAEDIAALLHSANPDHWPLEETQHHMRMHLDLTLQEAAHRLAGDFAQDIADYDAVHQAILEMSDYLSLGIIHQFPKQFRGPAS